ncbi:hypothetical protein OG948_29020 [Embleya sp. NBC_00888]|uniref:hypothetical protein n=1 Tax=Embleya sp. NBC_00888 TaxID=2975960 RepID=UPI00387017B5|nr:hypothetical protein OG948_29020 [Embleya sp. NBC_00888]
MQLELDPPYGVGPIKIGMSMDEAEAALRELGGDLSGRTRGFAHFGADLSIHVVSDKDGLVEAIEVHRSEDDFADTVLCLGVDVFGTPAVDVTRLLGELTPVRVETEGASLVAPDLLVALWQPFVPGHGNNNGVVGEGLYFRTALVASPGYYDKSGQHRAIHIG